MNPGQHGSYSATTFLRVAARAAQNERALGDLDASDVNSRHRVLARLHAEICDLHALCSDGRSFAPGFVALLIGHAELVAQVCRPVRVRSAEQCLLKTQRERAQNLAKLCNWRRQTAC